MSDLNLGHGMGWLPDFPDFRDHTLQHKQVQAVMGRSKVVKAVKAGLPASVDLRGACSPIEDQGALSSCTAHAVVGLVEYYERRAFGKHIDASRLFVYKTTRNLLHWQGDRGAYVRSALKALVLFGVPPEEYWAYVPGQLDDEPPAFCYAYGQNYQTIDYYRLDPSGTSPDDVLAKVKQMLASGYPAAFGFTVYQSIRDADKTGEIPYPADNDAAEGGHAVMAAGYDDSRKIGKQKGALLIRNSWGKQWGEQGYGWLPYAYMEAGLAVDFWTLTKQEWIDSGRFE